MKGNLINNIDQLNKEIFEIFPKELPETPNLNKLADYVAQQLGGLDP